MRSRGDLVLCLRISSTRLSNLVATSTSKGGLQLQAFGTFAHTRNAFHKVYGGTEIPPD